jgi:hypothetical protein
MTLTLSQVRDFSTGYLTDTAAYLNAEADRMEDAFAAAHGQVSGSTWGGTGADAAQQHYAADLATVTAHAVQLRQVAQAVNRAAEALGNARNGIMAEVTQAQQNGFTVADDFTIHDDPNQPAYAQIIRAPYVQAHTATLAAEATAFTAREQDATTALSGAAGLHFPESPPLDDVLAGIAVKPRRHQDDYNRAAFGPPWTANNDNPLGHNGCDTRDDILNRDLTNKTYVKTQKCPDAIATGILHDPYTGKIIKFDRTEDNGELVQIDHVVPLAYAWDMGANKWTEQQRIDFANDPDELLAVDGQANQDKLDYPPGQWMPPNTAFDGQYAKDFIAVLRKYHLPVDPASVPVLEAAAQ